MGRVNRDDRMNQLLQNIMEQIRISAHLKYDCVLECEHPASPIVRSIV
jgi:hypothetical protein